MSAITAQELFNASANHILNQGAKSQMSYDVEDVCAYRGQGGLMCAVGCLITDDNYDKTLERQGVWNSRVKEAIANSIGRPLTRLEIKMMSQLQSCHDIDRPASWEAEIRRIAKVHDIEFIRQEKK